MHQTDIQHAVQQITAGILIANCRLPFAVCIRYAAVCREVNNVLVHEADADCISDASAGMLPM